MSRRALVVGGTGPTGPFVLRGLLERGFDVTIMHRGVHEPPDLPEVRHLHVDPHFREPVEAAIAGDEYDVVMTLYGRVNILADVFAKRTEHLVAVGGIPAYRGCLDPEKHRPYGMALMAREDGPVADGPDDNPFARLVIDAERAVLSQAADGAYAGTVVRYPCIYGPRNPIPYEWSVVQRIRDGRPHMILPDGGIGIISRCSARNAADVLLRIVDRPSVADGQVYNCVDRDQLTLRQWVDVVSDLVGGRLETIAIPAKLCATTFAELNPMPGMFPHVLVDGEKARRELGHEDVISERNAFAETVAWLEKNPPQPGQYPAWVEQFDYQAEDRLIEAYNEAAAWVLEKAGREEPERLHGMPHPKVVSSSGVDHRGR